MKKSLKSLQASAACLPQGLSGILAYCLAVILLSNKATLIIPKLNQQTNLFQLHLFPSFSYIRRRLTFTKTSTFPPSSPTPAASQYAGEQDRMRQAVLGAWALFNQLQT